MITEKPRPTIDFLLCCACTDLNSPNTWMKHIRAVSGLHRDHFGFNAKDSLNRLRTEDIFLLSLYERSTSS
jgi:hypothetical protein